jgi:hypothetical protein
MKWNTHTQTHTHTYTGAYPDLTEHKQIKNQSENISHKYLTYNF